MIRPLRRMLSALRLVSAGREEFERLAAEQPALRRVATLVAQAAAPEEIFAAVAEEAGHVLPEADFTMVSSPTRSRAPDAGPLGNSGARGWPGRPGWCRQPESLVPHHLTYQPDSPYDRTICTPYPKSESRSFHVRVRREYVRTKY